MLVGVEDRAYTWGRQLAHESYRDGYCEPQLLESLEGKQIAGGDVGDSYAFLLGQLMTPTI